jgi:hypothetical protein
MILQPTFDPTNPASGTFNLNLTGGYGKAVIFNESNSNLKLTYSNNFTDYLPAWTAIEVCFLNIPLTNPIVEYSTLSVLSGIVASPISQVAIVTYEAAEHVPGTYPAALVRSLSIGNQVNSTTTTNQVTNDGNPTVTTFIESTQQGNASGSNVAIGNDGSFTFAQFVSSVFTQYFRGIPGAAPAIQMGAKAVLTALDQAGANVSNILGIDSSGNTFLQSHKTNNQIVLYDKNGSTLATFDANHCLNLTGNIQTANGDTSGTMTIQEILAGGIKVTVVKQNNYRQNAATPQAFTLKNAFTGPYMVFNGGCGGMQMLSSSVNQQANYFNTVSATGGTHINESQAAQDSFGWQNNATDTVQSAGSYASAHTGVFVMIGF